MKFFYTPSYIKKISSHSVWDIHPTANEVFLTFDDGPNEEITTYILDRLKELEWKATFFCVGENAQKKPELLQRIIKEGHSLGNHTFHHKNAWKTPFKDYLNDIFLTDKVFHSTLFRPPYGKLSRKLSKTISTSKKIIMWTFMPYDFDESVSHILIKEKAIKYIKAGSIIVLHDNEKFIENEKIVFEIIVNVMKEKGLVSKAI